jgi:hypothetical protein
MAAVAMVHNCLIPRASCAVVWCTGRYMYKGGKLVPTSLDLYLALEYCDQGGQWLLWQQAQCCAAVTLQVAAHQETVCVL